MTETRAVIDDRCNRLGWRFKDAATVIGMSDRTLRKKCNEPLLFTGLELKRMGEFLTEGQMTAVRKEVETWPV